MSEHKFQLEVTNRLTGIEGQVKGVNSRLDELNGSVASNKKKVRRLEDELLIYRSRNKIKLWIYNNAAGIAATVIGAWILYKLGI